MIKRCRLRVPNSDEGAILIFALIIVTTIALVVGTLVTRGDGSLRATLAVRQAAGSSYAADAAANVAINDLRTGYGFSGNPSENGFDNSLDGIGCFGNKVGNSGTDTLALNNFYPAVGAQPATSALVECTGVTGTGQQGSPVPISNSNKPGYAIVTLKGPITTQDPLKVHGGVYSNSTIVGQVSLDAGDAWAFGSCTQTTVTAPAVKHCNSGTTIPDPNYTNDLGGTVPALQAPPTSCTSGVAVFTPGYYDDATALNTATNLCSVAWFKPGTYYFDFHNNGCANVCPSNLFSGGSTSNDTWDINGATVVGGTPTDASGNVLSIPPTTPSMPGACQSPITTVNAQGVQFVFGGDSHIYVDQNSHVELCGTYHSDRPPVELYGLKSGSTPTATTATALQPSGTPSTSGGGTWTNVSAANLGTGGSGATWKTTTGNAQSTTLTVPGFATASTVPAGAVLTAATLHVTHKEPDATANSKSSVTVKIGSTTTPSITVAATGSTSLRTTDIAITGTNLNSLQTEIHKNGYTGATIAYTANAKGNNATTVVGPITLDLTYYLPVLRGEDGTCVDAYNATATCQFISMKNGNNKILFYLQGTTYVPHVDVSVLLGNFSAEIAKFGIVAAQLEFAITNGNPGYTGPIFEIPDNSPGYGFENTTVDLTVHLCTTHSPCTASDPVALTARVQLWDPSGEPAPPGRQVSVLTWAEQH